MLLVYCAAAVIAFLSSTALGQGPPNGAECSVMCDTCDSLDLFMDVKSCPNCPCMAKLLTKKRTAKCDDIDRSIHCPYGMDFDTNGCPMGKCRRTPKGCPPSPLKTCDLICDKGYMTDANGCPTCECQCDNEGLNPKFVHDKCRDRCHPFRFQIMKDATGCDNCFCEKKGKLSNLCRGNDVTLACSKDCGRWGHKGGCSGDPCECQCPNPGLTCDHVVCPENQRPFLRNDTIGCRLACECPAPPKPKVMAPGAKPICAQVKCPSDCGQHDLIEERDENGCVVKCMCKCKNPKCALPCIMGSLTDIYGCPTCQCKIEDQCPLKCNRTCGPYDHVIPRDPQGCLGDCSCQCPPRPVCPINCQETQIERDRYNCERCRCKDLQCGIACPIDCGPHGFKLDAEGCPLCECNCPEQITCPLCPNGGQTYLSDGYGCKSCQCQCPALNCKPGCKDFALDKNGCQTCQCVDKPPQPEKPMGDSHVLRTQCPQKPNCGIRCDSDIWGLNDRGCQTCTCCPSLQCTLQCALRVDKDGCPLCQCAA